MSMTASLLGLTAAITLITGGKTSNTSSLATPPTVPAQASPAFPYAQQVLDLVNAERKSRKLSPLTLNAKLTVAAQKHAEDMVARTYFSHETPEKKTALDRIRATGYLDPPCACSLHTAYGENIARGQTTAAQVMRDWMNSPVHKGNILTPGFREMGVGFKNNVWVETFGTNEVIR